MKTICYMNSVSREANLLIWPWMYYWTKISEALDRGECVIGVFLDVSKAFDSVDHSILLRKCKNMISKAWLYVG